MNKKQWVISAACLLIAVTAMACGEAGTSTSTANSADSKAKAEQLLTKMTEKLKSTPAFSFKTAEITDRPKRGGGAEKLNIARDVTVKTPDRLYFKATGDRDLEAFYDGKSMILMSHKDKVWGQLNAPPTLTETVDRIEVHYGMPLPVADLLGLDATGKLRNAANVGSIEKKETVGGVECDVLKFQNPDVDWEVWIPVTGEPLPKKFHAKYKTAKGQPESTIEFSDWNLSPQITDTTFLANIPDEYEGIPIVQRASAVIPKLEAEEKKTAANSNVNTVAPADAGKK